MLFAAAMGPMLFAAAMGPDIIAKVERLSETLKYEDFQYGRAKPRC